MDHTFSLNICDNIGKHDSIRTINPEAYDAIDSVFEQARIEKGNIPDITVTAARGIYLARILTDDDVLVTGFPHPYNRSERAVPYSGQLVIGSSLHLEAGTGMGPVRADGPALLMECLTSDGCHVEPKVGISMGRAALDELRVVCSLGDFPDEQVRFHTEAYGHLHGQ